MRILIALPALLALGACNVSKNGNAVTVQYDQNKAQNTVADVSNTAQNVAGDIGNDVKSTSNKIQSKTGDNGNSSSTSNSVENKQ
jgi:hypothetical protein